MADISIMIGQIACQSNSGERSDLLNEQVNLFRRIAMYSCNHTFTYFQNLQGNAQECNTMHQEPGVHFEQDDGDV